MSREFRPFSISSVKTKTLVKETIRFDEENIRETLHPTNKDYGFMIFSEAKTPFPRYADPVAAEELRKRLQECLEGANGMARNYYEAGVNDERYEMYETQTPQPSLVSENEEMRQSEFIRKRRQFNQAEFIITQQKSMSLEMPEPGPSIGNNWRILDNDASYFIHQVPPNLTAVVDASSVPRRHFSISYEMLLEFAGQMPQSTDPHT